MLHILEVDEKRKRMLLPIFIITPVIEMYLLIQVGGLIGALPTIGLVLLTAMIGLALLKQQGLSTLMRANQKLASGDLPAEEVVEGLLLAVGGALLLTPGFVTDFIGFSCLLPFTRAAIAKRIIAKGLLNAVNMQQAGGGAQFHYQHFEQHDFEGFKRQQNSSAPAGDIIDGEASEIKDDHLLKK